MCARVCSGAFELVCTYQTVQRKCLRRKCVHSMMVKTKSCLVKSNANYTSTTNLGVSYETGSKGIYRQKIKGTICKVFSGHSLPTYLFPWVRRTANWRHAYADWSGPSVLAYTLEVPFHMARLEHKIMTSALSFYLFIYSFTLFIQIIINISKTILN